MEQRVIRVVIGFVIARVVSEVAADFLKEIGVPKRVATVAGGIIAGLL